jgi:hypothetical protein
LWNLGLFSFGLLLPVVFPRNVSWSFSLMLFISLKQTYINLLPLDYACNHRTCLVCCSLLSSGCICAESASGQELGRDPITTVRQAFFFFFFGMGFVMLSRLDLNSWTQRILPFQPSECWDYRHMPLCMACQFF